MKRNYPWVLGSMPENGRNLLKWPEKFQSEQPHIAGNILAQHLGRDRRGLVRHQAGRNWGRRRNCKVHDLVGAQDMRRSDACPCRANVQGLGQFDELDTRTIRATQEYGYLQWYPGRLSTLQLLQLRTFLKTLGFHSAAPSTSELVRIRADLMPEFRDRFAYITHFDCVT